MSKMSETQKRAIPMARQLKPTAAWRDRQTLATDLEKANEWLNYAWASHYKGHRQSCIADLLDAKEHLKNLIALLDRLES